MATKICSFCEKGFEDNGHGWRFICESCYSKYYGPLKNINVPTKAFKEDIDLFKWLYKHKDCDDVDDKFYELLELFKSRVS